MPEFTPIAQDPSRPVHIPVLLREVVRLLDLRDGLTVVDGTVGAAGHSREILARISPNGRLIGLDRDSRMLEIAAHQLSHSSSVQLHHASYAELPRVLAGLQTPAVDRILLDLGLSSDQLADESRGFSFDAQGPLDLRFDITSGQSAAELLTRLSEAELAQIFEIYGEDPAARRIAGAIVSVRESEPIETARQLADVVVQSLQPGRKPNHVKQPTHENRHPATRVFQALRIYVNREIEQLERILGGILFDCLKPGGIAAIITFHSLEDRLVKQAFRDPQSWQLLSPKPITASPAELRFNPRSRTARLRGAIRR